MLLDLNKLDLELWAFAEDLVSKRLKMHQSFSEFIKHEGNAKIASSASLFMHKSDFSCFKVPSSFNDPKPLPLSLSTQLGIFRPVGHKGPL